jgi:RNA polymerase sigma-B factor
MVTTNPIYPNDDSDWVDEALVRLAAEPSEALRAEIIERANWLAVRGARRFADYGEQFDDLLQVARIGLMKAVDRFDHTRGVPFGAYATPTIMGELRRHFRDHTWAVHVPRRAKDLRPTVNAVTERLSNELGRSPRVSEIAAAMNVSVDAVLEVHEANFAYKVKALDAAVVGQAVAHDDTDLDHVLDQELVGRLLETLPERERTILTLRFYEGLTQSQIAERLGLSQVHVGRLLTATLASLRDQLDDGALSDATPA